MFGLATNSCPSQTRNMLLPNFKAEKLQYSLLAVAAKDYTHHSHCKKEKGDDNLPMLCLTHWLIRSPNIGFRVEQVSWHMITQTCLYLHYFRRTSTHLSAGPLPGPSAKPSGAWWNEVNLWQALSSRQIFFWRTQRRSPFGKFVCLPPVIPWFCYLHYTLRFLNKNISVTLQMLLECLPDIWEKNLKATIPPPPPKKVRNCVISSRSFVFSLQYVSELHSHTDEDLFGKVK